MIVFPPFLLGPILQVTVYDLPPKKQSEPTGSPLVIGHLDFTSVTQSYLLVVRVNKK